MERTNFSDYQLEFGYQGLFSQDKVGVSSIEIFVSNNNFIINRHNNKLLLD